MRSTPKWRWSHTEQRRRVKHALTFEDRFACRAERLRDEARKMPVGELRDEVLRRAPQAETRTLGHKWLASSNLR